MPPESEDELQERRELVQQIQNADVSGCCKSLAMALVVKIEQQFSLPSVTYLREDDRITFIEMRGVHKKVSVYGNKC